MTTLDELKKKWESMPGIPPNLKTYDRQTLETIFKSRLKKYKNAAMSYFWSAFVMQIIVYALLCHIIIRYWSDGEAFWLSIAGIFLFLPFTVILMRKFKAMAVTHLQEGDDPEKTLYHYVLRHHTLLLSFYRFKKVYEWILIPLASIIGIVLTFKLYVPGSIAAHPVGAAIILVITLLSCALAIRSENKKKFELPLHRLKQILDEFRNTE